jgi:alpha 1,3-glucosidase
MGEPTTTHLRNAVLGRYQLLPFFYTLYHTASVIGYPVMRPLWAHYGDEPVTFTMDDQFLVGSDYLVKPVTAAGTTSTSVYFPGKSTLWYDVTTAQPVNGGQSITVETPIHKIPVYQRGGSIVPKKMRVRRSSATMRNDPYTLIIALDTDAASKGGSAEGDLYLDDEHSFDSTKLGTFSRRRFSWSGNTLSCVEAPAPYGNPNVGGASKPLTLAPSVTIERILVWGWDSSPTKVLINVNGKEPVELGFAYNGGVLGIRKPDVHVMSDFTLTIE